jgi:DNA polymerase III alpha subunit
MEIDKFGVAFQTTNELCDLLYRDPSADLYKALVSDPEEFNVSVKKLYCDIKPLQKYTIFHRLAGQTFEDQLHDFDTANQEQWLMPDKYKKLDIAEWLLAQCANEEELQRVGKELLMYQDRGLMPLLKYMKYFVDTMRKNNVVWGVGRGSSTASFVLFLIGVHKIDSIFYDLDIEEFLKPMQETQ